MSKSYFITTLGCPKNQADSREMERNLLSSGFLEAASPDEADFHIINSCAFIQEAREETIAVAFEAAAYKKKNQKLILAGCFSERYLKAVEEEMPEVDFAFGTGQFSRVGELISKKFHEELISGVKENYLGSQIYAPLKISEGCSRSCTFCAIPSFRGKFQNIGKEGILKEALLLSKEGVKELNLVSQDTVSYGRGPEDLYELLLELQEIQGIEWLRLLYLYPDRKTEKLLQLIQKKPVEKLVPYFESPLQHVSSKILRAMKRSGSADFYRELFALSRSIHPDMEIRTSFLLGFPGENEDDADAVFEFVKSVKPEKLSLFMFSPEENTAAFEMKDIIPEKVTAARMNRIRDLHLELLSEMHRKRVGRSYKCLIDAVDDEGIMARRPQDAPEIDELVHLDLQPNLKRGDFIPVTITGFYEYDMTGKIDA